MSLRPRQTASSITRIIDQIAYPGLKIELAVEVEHSRRSSLRVTCPDGTCNVTGKPLPWNGRWWRLSYHMTDTEVVLTAFKAILTALEHEAREKFTFKGQAVLDSHIDINELVRLRAEGKTDGRDG